MLHPWRAKRVLFLLTAVASPLLWLLNPLLVLHGRDEKRSARQTFSCMLKAIPPQDFCPADPWLSRARQPLLVGAEQQSTRGAAAVC